MTKPWMLLLRCCCLDCSTALDCLLFSGHLGQPPPSPGPPLWIPAHSGSSLLAFNLYRGSTCTSQSLTGVPALPCGCFTLRITLRGLQGL